MSKAYRLVRVEGVPIVPGVAYALKPFGAGYVHYQEADLPPSNGGGEIHYIGSKRVDQRDGTIRFPLCWKQGGATLQMKVQFGAPAAGRFKDLCAEHVAVFEVAADFSGADLVFKHLVTHQAIGKIWMPAVVDGDAHPHDAEPAREPVRERCG